MDVNKIIKNRRIELQLTLKDVAKALGVAESTVSRYETSDIQNMGIDKIKSLASVLKCSPGYLMGWEENKNSLHTPKETILLEHYNKLNEKGKDEAIKRVSELTEINKYTELEDYNETGLAAHDDDLNNEEKENCLNIAKQAFKDMD